MLIAPAAATLLLLLYGAFSPRSHSGVSTSEAFVFDTIPGFRG